MAAHILVVANVTATSRDLLDAIQARAAKGPIEVTLVMPGQGPGLSGREAVRERLGQALATWSAAGIEADGVVGDQDPVDAVAELWDPRHHDELIVSTLPGQSSKWIRSDLPQRLRKLTGAPLTHVVATDMRPEPHMGPPPSQEHSPLGPLAVLSWGGRGAGK
ncbi:MAG: hypothetical protein QOE28_347 [Solirubrobacteraceae bacterium]|jgi:hypothetical protein|nr:hypothetical protein [Solirubrobacteraceae bacterium]